MTDFSRSLLLNLWAIYIYIINQLILNISDFQQQQPNFKKGTNMNVYKQDIKL